MKKFFKSSRFLISGLIIAGVGLTLSAQTWAEDQPKDQWLQLEAQVKELLDFKQQIQANTSNNIDFVKEFKNVDPEPQPAGGDGTAFPPKMYCTQDYLEWPSSGIYKEANWAMEDHLRSTNSNVSQYLDLNGDGLTDYFLLTLYQGFQTEERGSCVYLNNGHGWDLSYKCLAKMNVKTWTFYGDCAQQ